MDRAAIAVVYFVASNMQIFLYCWYGQQLTNEAEKIRNDVYLLNWTERPRNYCNALIMMMRQLGNPLYLNAMGFALLTLSTFQGILRAAGSYFTLLQSFQEAD